MAVETDILPGRYRAPRPIGRGGMGVIYRATDDALGRAVAIKLLAEAYAADESVRERFTREALTAARLSGEPHTVTIYDVGVWKERPFIVMEYLSGGSLDDSLQEGGAQEPSQVLTWLEQAALALDAAHRNGVVHRDVKPGNLLLDRDGNVHVADFGIASAAGLDSFTQPGTVLGTAGYLSPEQASGERATPASDRYALAVVAYELLSGTRPFQNETPTAEAAAHVHGDAPPIGSVNPDLPRELETVFAKALAKEPAARYATCGEFVGALRDAFAHAAGPTRAFSVPSSRPLPSPGRTRHSRLPILLALIAGALLAGGIAAAILLTDGGDGAQRAAEPASARTLVRTITAQGTTVTAPATTQPATSASTTVAAPPAGGHSLNDEGYAKMRAGDWAGALPLLQEAVRKLQGTGPGDPYEGYANYNLGYTLMQLDRCDEALAYLQQADRLEPGNRDVRRALKRADKCK